MAGERVASRLNEMFDTPQMFNGDGSPQAPKPSGGTQPSMTNAAPEPDLGSLGGQAGGSTSSRITPQQVSAVDNISQQNTTRQPTTAQVSAVVNPQNVASGAVAAPPSQPTYSSTSASNKVDPASQGFISQGTNNESKAYFSTHQPGEWIGNPQMEQWYSDTYGPEALALAKSQSRVVENYDPAAVASSSSMLSPQASADAFMNVWGKSLDPAFLNTPEGQAWKQQVLSDTSGGGNQILQYILGGKGDALSYYSQGGPGFSGTAQTGTVQPGGMIGNPNFGFTGGAVQPPPASSPGSPAVPPPDKSNLVVTPPSTEGGRGTPPSGNQPPTTGDNNTRPSTGGGTNPRPDNSGGSAPPPPAITPPSTGNYDYRNPDGSVYNGGPESVWQDPATGQWYKGNKASGQVVPTAPPSWAIHDEKNQGGGFWADEPLQNLMKSLVSGDGTTELANQSISRLKDAISGRTEAAKREAADRLGAAGVRGGAMQSQLRQLEGAGDQGLAEGMGSIYSEKLKQDVANRLQALEGYLTAEKLNTDLGIANRGFDIQKYLGDLSNKTQQSSIDKNYDLGLEKLDLDKILGLQGDSTTQRGQDMQLLQTLTSLMQNADDQTRNALMQIYLSIVGNYGGEENG